MSRRDAAALQRAAADLGAMLSIDAARSVLRYADSLVRWTQVHNLTALRDGQSVWTHHLLDCLAVLPVIERHTAARNRISILDVGSGAGLPGLLIAIARPDWVVTCVDSVGKKMSFVRQSAIDLSVGNVTAIHARVESLPAQHADAILTRAFATLRTMTDLTRSHMASDGVWVAMKGRLPVDEMQELPSDIDVFHVKQLEIPGLDAERHVVSMRLHETAIPLCVSDSAKQAGPGERPCSSVEVTDRA